MRPEAYLCALGGLFSGVAGLMRLAGGRRQSRPLSRWQVMLLPSAAIAALLAAVIWRGAALGAWPGGTTSDALSLWALGGLVLALWDGRRESEGTMGEGGQFTRDRGPWLLVIGVMALAAAGSEWLSPQRALLPQARNWLFGLRSVLLGLGLAGWVPAIIETLWPRRRTERAFDGAEAALQASFPWLTMAVLAGGIWSMTAYALPWRGAQAEIWVLVSWLLAGVGLHLAPSRSLSGVFALLIALGSLASLLGVWRAGTLFW